MVGPFPGVAYSFGALRQTYGPLFVRCDVCRRYARLYLAEIRDTDYRTKTFSSAGVARMVRSPSQSRTLKPG
jgi:hypothetical protein